MIFSRRALSIGLIGLSLLLCMLICACTHEPTQPSDTSPSTDPVPDTDPESAPAVTEKESRSDTAPESVEESDTVAPETAPDMEEDPALNVYPTDGQYIDIGAFFEPDAAHTNAEHYDWIKDAHITYVDSVNWDTAITEEINLLQAQLCEERGIRLSYYPRRYGVDLTSKSSHWITEYCRELMAKNAAITDLHVIDEPHNPWAYAKVLNAVSEAGMTPRINYLPQLAVEGIGQSYRGHIEDTVIAVGKDKYPTLYFDHYPYNTIRGSIPDMFYNMESVRVIGLKYDLPTGLYLQCFGDGGCRRPNAHEIRYQASAALAYGYKSLTYFTWWTTNPPENVHNYAIIAPDGSKTDLYDEVVAINGQITVTGPLLMHLDALEVYHTAGSETGIILRGKDELPLFPASSGQFGFVVSLMEDSDTGRDYIMLVNKNFKKDVTTTVTVSDAITYLYDCTNGAYEAIDISSGSFEAEFLPGGYMLLAVGQRDNIVDRPLDKGANLAEGKTVSVHAVNPGNGCYAYCLTDGIRDNTVRNAQGFRSAQNKGYAEVDLGRVTSLNRVDVYPTGTLYAKGSAFPKAFTIEVSTDGETWTTVATSEGVDATLAVPTFTFETVQARYVRMNVTKGCATGGFEIAEIEIYLDDGSIPAPEAYPTSGPSYDAGSNVAADPHVRVICSSAYEEGTFWRIDGINDGRIFDVNEASGLYCGWSSNVFVNKEQEGATEWIGYDFGVPVKVKAVVVHPAQNSMPVPQGFPLSYCVEISDDGVNWTSVYSVEDDPTADQFVSHVLEFDPVTTRYIRFRGTKLTTVGDNGIFGYMMQMSEIEVLAG